jgi:hypothetical protein
MVDVLTLVGQLHVALVGGLVVFAGLVTWLTRLDRRS